MLETVFKVRGGAKATVKAKLRRGRTIEHWCRERRGLLGVESWNDILGGREQHVQRPTGMRQHGTPCGCASFCSLSFHPSPHSPSTSQAQRGPSAGR